MSFINTSRRAELLIKAIMERIANCAVTVDLQNEMLLLASRGIPDNAKARIKWAEETRQTMALGPGIIFDPLPTDKSILQTSLQNWFPEAIHGFFHHVVKRPLDHLAAFENNIQFGPSRQFGGMGSGTILTPS